MSPSLFSEDFLLRLERISLAAHKAVAGQTQGERRSPRRGQSVEFADFRPYTSGDDIRRIDWNAYARLEKFFIKLFVEEEDLTVHFIIDVSRSMSWGQPQKLDYALRVAGALGYIALCGLDRITALAIGTGRDDVFTPHRGKRQALNYFNYLQNCPNLTGTQTTKSDPARSLRAYAGQVKRPGPLLVLSDLMDDGWLDGLRSLTTRGFEVSLIHILAPEEADPQMEGDLKLLDAEGGAEVEITADYDLLARYRQNLEAWQTELKNFSQRRGIHYIPLVTTLPLEQLLFAWMHQRGLLR